jgi:dCMP deaminase
MNKWDQRFIELAHHISSWSKDHSTQCGAVIVRPDKTIASVGFNGFPKGTDDASKLYKDRELKLSRIIHAEQNAILHASEDLSGYTIYTWPPGLSGSCDRCTAHIIQAGIKRIVHVYDDSSEFSERWNEAAKRANQLYTEAGTEVLQIPIHEWETRIRVFV